MHVDRILQDMKGTVRWNTALSAFTWFKVGGKTPAVLSPADEAELRTFLRAYTGPRTILGAGSNVLIRDGGLPGVVIRLGRPFQTLYIEGTEVEVGAGLLGRTVAQYCQQAGLAGTEFLATIPGTIGGNIRMNAGCYGREIRDLLMYAWAMDPQGEKHKLSVDDLQYGYRSSGLPEGWILLGARFKGAAGHPDTIAQQMQAFMSRREATQPLCVRTGGSTFKNPPGHKAWELIDQAGYRGYRYGGAQISEKHCNFLINHGTATAQALETLGEKARQAVYDKTGICLEWEIIRLGQPREQVQ